MKTKLSCSALHVAPDTTLYHTGPPLDLGPLPSLFYFALSGPDSLTLDPFNQPIQFLHGSMIRAFSMDLPAHENELPAVEAIKVWAEDFSRGRDVLSEFFEKAEKAIDFALREKFCDPNKMGVAGLSRGGLVALHMAAREEAFKTVLLFAPITKLQNGKDFSPLKENPLVNFLDPTHLKNDLIGKQIRTYIGNRDTRVSTRSCFDFMMELVEFSHLNQIRSPRIELMITPSIGQHGHGTAPEIFKQGANWIQECLT